MNNKLNPFLSNNFPPNFLEMSANLADTTLTELLQGAKQNISNIENLSEKEINFANTIRALDRAALKLSEVWTIVNHLESVSSSQEFRELLNKKDAEISEFNSSIFINEKLWKNVNICKEKNENLNAAEKILLEETLRSFLQNGANLNSAQKAELQEIEAKLAALTRKFSENALDAQNAFELLVKEKSELKGLPESALNLAKKKAEEKNLEGFLLTLDAPIFAPLLSYCENETLRKKLWSAYGNLCDKDAWDNTQIMQDIIALRDTKAKLLGKENFADFILQNRMAKDGNTALNFVENLHSKFQDAFKKDISEIESFAGAKKLDPWNVAFVAEKMRKKNYDFDQENFRPYFSLEKSLDGAFALAKTLFGLNIKKSESPSWHESVRFFEVSDEKGKHIASFYADLFPRKGKRAGAWMNLLKDEDGTNPKLGLIAANFNEPSGNAPSLLNHDELSTLFHEFGHLIHFILMDAPEYGLRTVAWDFVELPSQIMENWCAKFDFLKTFASHYQTNEALSKELFEKFDKSKKFRGASFAMRQLSFAKIDLELHTNVKKYLSPDIENIARETLKDYCQEYTQTPHTILHHFTHIFGDPVGYAAAYYSYKWAESLDADAFTRFEKEGIFNPKTGRDFANKILKPGKTIDELQAFKNFMGRAPDPESLVNRTI